MKHLVFVVCVICGCGELAACGNPTSGVSQTIQSSSPRASGVPSDGAPAVGHPLDTRRFLTNPCSVLTKSERVALEIRSSGTAEPHAALGAECSWGEAGDVTRGVYTSIFVKGGAGLSAPYSNKDTGFFQEIPPISGYPAVISMTDDGRAQGDCTLSIGLSDTQALAVGAVMLTDAPNFGNPCGVAAKLADKMIDTIKGAQ